jgi:hypothetical protein
MPTVRCEHCKFWQSLYNGKGEVVGGECHLNPPPFPGKPTKEDRYPRTAKGFWCDKYVRKGV